MGYIWQKEFVLIKVFFSGEYEFCEASVNLTLLYKFKVNSDKLIFNSAG